MSFADSSYRFFKASNLIRLYQNVGCMLLVRESDHDLRRTDLIHHRKCAASPRGGGREDAEQAFRPLRSSR
jgi:hypothetical protein